MAADLTSSAGDKHGPRRKRAGRIEARAGILFALPWMTALLVFTFVPLVLTFFIAQAKFQIVGPPEMDRLGQL